MRGSKVIAACIFNEHQAVGLFLAFDGASTCTDPFISGKKYRKLVNNFIRNKSLFFVSPRLLHSVCPGGYQIQTIAYGKILVMLVYGEYYGRVYEVYNKNVYDISMKKVRHSMNYKLVAYVFLLT